MRSEMQETITHTATLYIIIVLSVVMSFTRYKRPWVKENDKIVEPTTHVVKTLHTRKYDEN